MPSQTAIQGLGAAALLAFFSSSCAEAGDSPRPNVVVYLVDTLRADHLGCYGYERDTSPHLDAFAEEAVLFERCIAQSTWTKPATASVLTGLLPSQHRAVHRFSTLPENVWTLAERLREQGYRTGAVGWNPFVFAPESGLDQGFDAFRAVDERADAIVDAALEWVDEVEEPFFLYVHVVDPHEPYWPPENLRGRFAPPLEDGRPNRELRRPPEDGSPLPEPDRERMVALYDGEVRSADGGFGRLLAGLEERSAVDDALVCFLSDHGEEFYDHGSWSHNQYMYQEVLHVPLVVRFPGAPELAGARVQAVVGQIDLVPTLLDVLDLDPEDDLPGRSLLRVARGETPPRLLISEVDDARHRRGAVVLDRFKYVRAWEPEEGEWLYDLEADPGETRDLVSEHPEAAAELRSRLDEHVAESSPGVRLVAHNSGDEVVTLQVLVLTEDAPLASFDARGLEQMDSGSEGWDGPFEAGPVDDLPGLSGHGLHLVLRLDPGDRDELAFLPAEGETRLRFDLSLGGGDELPPESVRIGAEAARPARSSFEVELADGTLHMPPPDASDLEEEGGLVVWIWRGLVPETEERAHSEETRAALAALGYGGDE